MKLALAVSASAGFPVPAAPAAVQGQPAGVPVRAVLTTANLSAALTPQPGLRLGGRRPPAGTPIIHVSARVKYQRVTGFGAAMTDTSAWLIHDELSPSVRTALMNDLFGVDGIGLSLVRVPIGASDFTATGVPYSYDDLPAGQTDPGLNSFSIAHDQAYIIPSLQQMLRINPAIQISATPWSPPPWMKANDTFGDYGGTGTLIAQDYQPLAEYFVKFIQAYAAHHTPISAITPQNEPGGQPPYPGLNLSPQEEAAFVTRYLRPALRAARLHPQIYGVDRGTILAYADELLRDTGADGLNGISWHCYGGLDVLSQLHAEHPSVDQIVSECSPGIVPYAPSEFAIDATRNWASAASLWNLALDPGGGPVQLPNIGCPGCTGVVTVSELTHTVTLNANYYGLGQVSRFVRPGAVRIYSSRFVHDFHSVTGGYGVTSGLDNVAFANRDGRIAVVAYNHSSTRSAFAVEWGGRYFRYGLSPGATVTFTWDQANGSQAHRPVHRPASERSGLGSRVVRPHSAGSSIRSRATR